MPHRVTGADLDIWRAAKLLVDRHGGDTPVRATQRADQRLATGGIEGRAVWLRIQAAASVGLGVSILPKVAILADHRALKPADGFPSITNTEIVLAVGADTNPATRRLADVPTEFCSATDPREAA